MCRIRRTFSIFLKQVLIGVLLLVAFGAVAYVVIESQSGWGVYNPSNTLRFRAHSSVFAFVGLTDPEIEMCPWPINGQPCAYYSISGLQKVLSWRDDGIDVLVNEETVHFSIVDWQPNLANQINPLGFGDPD